MDGFCDGRVGSEKVSRVMEKRELNGRAGIYARYYLTIYSFAFKLYFGQL